MPWTFFKWKPPQVFTGGRKGDIFGFDMAMNEGGTTLAVGARGAENPRGGLINIGRVYLYERNGKHLPDLKVLCSY